MLVVTNAEFLSAIFGERAPFAHVTDFIHDPSSIPDNRRCAAWKGDYYSRYKMQEGTNQYFTISLFSPDDGGVARRRKALFQSTPCVVLDDVKEKLSMDEVVKLPPPSWVLETSPGSEQWGYILDEPCATRSRVENLLDGLVANGLAPQGKDPGMKGVTRYVRLPEGYNLKQSKMVDGQPYKCVMHTWSPFTTVTLEDLAAPFHVDLDAERREGRVDGAADVGDHPLLDVPDVVAIKEVRSAGRFDIICPWVGDHTGGEDSGSAIFTNDDGSIGFKCHHGACQHRTGRDLLNAVEATYPNFKEKLAGWQLMRAFAPVAPPPVSFMGDEVGSVSFIEETPVSFAEEAPAPTGIADAIRHLDTMIPRTAEHRNAVSAVLKAVDTLSCLDKSEYHEQVRAMCGWNKGEFKSILAGLRAEWYDTEVAESGFYSRSIFVKELNQFYDLDANMLSTPEGFQNSNSHEDQDARVQALVNGRCDKVIRLDYAPRKPRIFDEGGITYGNTWSAKSEVVGVEGDASPWLNHFDVLGWGEHKEHILQWMAYTILYPENKINHMLVLGGPEGTGKDFLLTPLSTAMGTNYSSATGTELLTDFNEYLMGAKYLHINEADPVGTHDAKTLYNKLKPLAAAPPTKLSVNLKNTKKIVIRNIVNLTMATNSRVPFRPEGGTRRIFAVWTDVEMNDLRGDMSAEWCTYWHDMWEWMSNGGAQHCIWYLRNCVDLTTFNPSGRPPVTDCLRGIQETSKTDLQVTIESFVRHAKGPFKADLMTPDDVAIALQSGDILGAHLMDERPAKCTSKRVRDTMATMRSVYRVNGIPYREDIPQLYALRNREKYAAMGGEAVFDEYLRQISEVTMDPKQRMKIVK